MRGENGHFQRSKRLRLRLKMLSPPRLRPETPQRFRRRVSTVEKRQFFDGQDAGSFLFPPPRKMQAVL